MQSRKFTIIPLLAAKVKMRSSYKHYYFPVIVKKKIKVELDFFN